MTNKDFMIDFFGEEHKDHSIKILGYNINTIEGQKVINYEAGCSCGINLQKEHKYLESTYIKYNKALHNIITFMNYFSENEHRLIYNK